MTFDSNIAISEPMYSNNLLESPTLPTNHATQTCYIAFIRTEILKFDLVAEDWGRPTSPV